MQVAEERETEAHLRIHELEQNIVRLSGLLAEDRSEKEKFEKWWKEARSDLDQVRNELSEARRKAERTHVAESDFATAHEQRKLAENQVEQLGKANEKLTEERNALRAERNELMAACAALETELEKSKTDASYFRSLQEAFSILMPNSS